MAISKNKKSSNKRNISKKSGKKAHKETIGPSHKKCQKFLELNSKSLVTPPTGRPDFIIHNKIPEYFELKPIIGQDDRKFLSKSQESEISRLLKNKIPVSMIYYKKSQKRKSDKFQFVVKTLTLSNLKKYCFSTKDSERVELNKIEFSDKYF